MAFIQCPLWQHSCLQASAEDAACTCHQEQLQLVIHVIYPMHCLMPGVLCPIDPQHLACVEDLKVANACRQMTDMHHVGDKRMDRYHELGQVRLIP